MLTVRCKGTLGKEDAVAQDKLNTPSARLFKYHPIRFHVLRDDPLWIETAYMAQEQIQEDRKWSLLGIAERLAFDHREQSLLFPEECLQFPIERVNAALLDEDEGGSGEASAEEMVFQAWHAGGENIFALSSISAALADSGALNVSMNSIKLPFESFYIYWGAQAGLTSPSSGRFIDGCYVSKGLGKFCEFEDEDAFDLMFTSSFSEDYQWHKHSLLANLVVDAEGVMHCIGAFSDDQTIGGIGETLKDGHTYPENAARWKAHIHAALNMAANCLCYLAWDKSEIRSASGISERDVVRATIEKVWR